MRGELLSLLQSKNITLNFQTEQDVIMAYFDVDKLDKIIYNLLSNALKYNYQDGMVSISLSQVVQNDRRYFMLKVENTGDGIPESKLPLLFKRFYEGDYRKFKTKGNRNRTFIDKGFGRVTSWNDFCTECIK